MRNILKRGELLFSAWDIFPIPDGAAYSERHGLSHTDLADSATVTVQLPDNLAPSLRIEVGLEVK
jgi:hypothetical protein